MKKCYYEYISKGLQPIFGLRGWKGKRLCFYAPPVRFLVLSEMFCLFRYAWRMIWLLLAYCRHGAVSRVFVMMWRRADVMMCCLTSSRCIRSGVCCGVVPCAVSGLLCVAVCRCRAVLGSIAVPCAVPIHCRCRYAERSDARSVYSNAYSTPYKTDTTSLW